MNASPAQARIVESMAGRVFQSPTGLTRRGLRLHHRRILTPGTSSPPTALPFSQYVPKQQSNMNTRKSLTLLLDDGVYFVALSNPMSGSESAGLLERRCVVTDLTPNGSECVGTFIRTPAGLWAARLATAFDPATGLDYRQLGVDGSRLDAIASLWGARHSACIARQS